MWVKLGIIQKSKEGDVVHKYLRDLYNASSNISAVKCKYKLYDEVEEYNTEKKNAEFYNTAHPSFHIQPNVRVGDEIKLGRRAKLKIMFYKPEYENLEYYWNWLYAHENGDLQVCAKEVVIDNQVKIDVPTDNVKATNKITRKMPINFGYRNTKRDDNDIGDFLIYRFGVDYDNKRCGYVGYTRRRAGETNVQAAERRLREHVQKLSPTGWLFQNGTNPKLSVIMTKQMITRKNIKKFETKEIKKLNKLCKANVKLARINLTDNSSFYVDDDSKFIKGLQSKSTHKVNYTKTKGYSVVGNDTRDWIKMREILLFYLGKNHSYSVIIKDPALFDCCWL